MLRLMKLMSGNENYTITELSKKLDMSYRTVYRYIETFKASGFVVNKVRTNVYKIGKMPRSHVDMKNLIYFSEEEAYIINDIINGLHDSNQLKSGLMKKLSAIYSCTSIADYVHSAETSVKIEKLGQAIREKKKVILKAYESANSQEISDRFIEPFEFTTNCLDIWAYDIEKCENKVFKISRIGEVVIIDDVWNHTERHQKSITDCFRISGFVQTPVKLELSIRAKNLLLEEYPLAEKDIRNVDRKWLLETKVSGMEGVGRFVIGLAGDIKVIDSPELNAYIQDFYTRHLSKFIK
ncbi:MAG: WYL domain-containing protein [Bacteroidales bacterium]|nr:WYL domain-containing protein [Bacteroidales bacterium]